jgi:hypothetical protein
MQDPLPRLVDPEFTALRDRGVLVQEVHDNDVIEIHPYTPGSLLTGLAGMAPGTDAKKFISGGWDPLVGTEYANHDPDRYAILPRVIKRDWVDRNRDSYSSGCFTERFMNEVKVLEISSPRPAHDGFRAWELTGMNIHNAAGVVSVDWGEDEGQSIWNPTWAGHAGNLFGVEMYESDRPSITGVVS